MNSPNCTWQRAGTTRRHVDVLVEFQPGVRVGLAFIRLQDELSAMLGRKVDLNTPASLSKYFREEVLDEAKVVYVAA